MFIILLGQPQDCVGQTEPHQTRDKQSQLIRPPWPFIFVALEFQEIITISSTGSHVGSLIVEWFEEAGEAKRIREGL